MQVAEAMQSLGCHPRDSAFKAGSIFRELGEMDRGGAVVFLLMEYPIGAYDDGDSRALAQQAAASASGPSNVPEAIPDASPAPIIGAFAGSVSSARVACCPHALL